MNQQHFSVKEFVVCTVRASLVVAEDLQQEAASYKPTADGENIIVKGEKRPCVTMKWWLMGKISISRISSSNGNIILSLRLSVMCLYLICELCKI